MSAEQGRVTRAVDRMMAPGTTPGDERERAVVAQAASFGFTLGLYVSLVIALVAAILGAVLLPVVILVAMAVPTWSAIWYASRHHVNMHELVDQGDARTRTVTFAVVFGGLVLVLGAMAYTAYTGRGLIDLSPATLVGPEATGIGASLLKGGILGGLGGCVIGAIAIPLGARRRARRTADADDGE